MSGALSIPASDPWPDLRARSTAPELLDASLPESEVRKSLADLRFVNRWLGSRRGLLRAMAPYLPPRGASLFLHHFDAGELPGLLRDLGQFARRAIVVSDLRRALVPYLFGRATFPLLFKTRVSVHDGLVSIRRAFRDEELRAAFAAAGMPAVEIRRVFPYRLVAVAAVHDSREAA